jgi:hypothetical protein
MPRAPWGVVSVRPEPPGFVGSAGLVDSPQVLVTIRLQSRVGAGSFNDGGRRQGHMSLDGAASFVGLAAPMVWGIDARSRCGKIGPTHGRGALRTLGVLSLRPHERPGRLRVECSALVCFCRRPGGRPGCRTGRQWGRVVAGRIRTRAGSRPSPALLGAFVLGSIDPACGPRGAGSPVRRALGGPRAGGRAPRTRLAVRRGVRFAASPGPCARHDLPPPAPHRPSIPRLKGCTKRLVSDTV